MWFQGAMEYGPRALGQRSVLARPDRVALRDRLNLFRPARRCDDIGTCVGEPECDGSADT